MKYILRVLIVGLMAVVLAACGTHVDGLYQAPTLSYNSIYADHIGVGGVSSSINQLPPSIANSYASSVRNNLVEKYRGLDIMPAGQASVALGKPQYDAMMQSYQRSGVIEAQYLDALKKHIKGMRYLVFARIVENNVKTSRSQITSDIYYNTDRTMRVEYKVYDLSTQNIVWSGTIKKWKRNNNDYSIPGYDNDYNNDDYHHHRHHDEDQEAVRDATAIAATAIIDANHTYPTPPSEYLLFQLASKGFAARLPSKPKS